MYGPIPDICDPPDAITSIIVCVPNVLPPKPVVEQWKSVPCEPVATGFVVGVVVGVEEVPVVDPCVVLPRRVPVPPDMPKNVEPLEVDVDAVGLESAAVVVGAVGALVGATGAGATPSSCCRICISGDSEPVDVVVGGADVVVVVVPHSVPDVVGVDVGIVVEPRELPYTPRDVRSENVDVVVGGGVVTTVVDVPHPGSPDVAGSLPAPGTTPT